ncbi:hypothetical protein PGT21_010347 [Puccinia graminis f. sp. tritici]|uniref:Uncharacterized protein n=1 Tax=Puccinia graminis f. sp. tritici TaxID=56615 RepID=A0A5B0P8I6_PUCGR|nr:hypothetical protein PGT21_010347 [Puccinia graminis f. sp. tritici]
MKKRKKHETVALCKVHYIDSSTFPAWHFQLEDILAIQGVHNLVTNKLPRPIEVDSKDGKGSTCTSEQGYNPEDSAANWDALSDIAHSTIKLTLSVYLSIQYKDIKPANKFFKTICNAYERNTRSRRLLLEDNFWTACRDRQNEDVSDPIPGSVLIGDWIENGPNTGYWYRIPPPNPSFPIHHPIPSQCIG